MKKIVCIILGIFGVVGWACAQEQDSCVHLSEITVTGLTGNARLSRTPAPVSVVSPEYLHTRQFSNVIDAIARQPGVSQITTGNGISKPVIRGLGYNRVLVVAGGVRQEGQQWGDEHGVEVDAQSVHSVEILKGPASLMYGSDAMAGVLIFHDEPQLPAGEMKADVATEYQTNNGLFDYSVDFAGNRGKVVWNWRYSDKMAHDYKNKYDGYVPGSRFRERALSGLLGTNGGWGYSRLKLSYYHLTPGIVEGERNEETGELERTDNGKKYGKLAPFQQVHHYKAVADNSFLIGDGMLKVIAAYQQNRRQEYEESGDECGLDFMLHTVNYDVRYVMPEWGDWQANVGMSGMYQLSENKGDEFLIPAYNLFDWGVFATVSRSFAHRLHVSGGLRFDTRHLHSHSLTDDGEERFAAFSRTFSGLTGSIGAIYNASDRLDIRFNVSRGFRAPNLSELGSNGVHEGSFRYEMGNNRLKQEYSWQADAGMDYASEYLSLQLSLFANRIDNYIFLQRADGMAVDGVPVYRYTSGDARIWGGEMRLVLHPFRHLHFENSFSYVNSVQLHQPDESKYLPMTPAPRWISTLHYDIHSSGKGILDNVYAEIEADCNFRQNHVYRVNDTETPTPSYVLFNVSAGTDIVYRDKKRCSVYLTAGNIFDCAYQSHLSRLKYADVNAVTGRSGVFNMGRNIGIKVLVPIAL
ncbi:MAG: TonB-dependent receptor [Bacteroidales bacterium]|nr:TonB-dependent receptor [Bacteroidales bacterium]